MLFIQKMKACCGMAIVKTYVLPSHSAIRSHTPSLVHVRTLTRDLNPVLHRGWHSSPNVKVCEESLHFPSSNDPSEIEGRGQVIATSRNKYHQSSCIVNRVMVTFFQGGT